MKRETIKTNTPNSVLKKNLRIGWHVRCIVH